MRATASASDGHFPNQLRRRWISLKWRFVCIGVTILALFFVFRRIPPMTLLDTIRAMRVGWFIAAIILYGALFLPAAWRWHLALQIKDSVVSPSVTVRFTIIGHFFYLILFGGTVGDAAKAAFYSRRHQLPLPKTLASVWLDRLMGSGALLAFSVVVFAIAGLHGGFAGMKAFSIHSRAWWFLLILPALALLLFWLRRSRHESVLHRIALAFLEGGRRLLASPKTLLSGFLCSMLMECSMNGMLALNLQAVSHTPIPWLQLVWTFPLITVVSGLPITVAGIGARDGAAIALLGWCGLPPADAEAMSLLSLCVSALWGVVGAIMLWRESTGIESAAPPGAGEQ